MQETWKHSIQPATTITPHSVAGTSRINITYRFYRSSYSPKFTPPCKCGVEGVLRCVMKKGENLGRYKYLSLYFPPHFVWEAVVFWGESSNLFVRYYWTCYVGKSADGEGGCDWFEWAEMDDDGENIHPLRNQKRRESQAIEN